MRKIFIASAIFMIWAVSMMVDASHVDDFQNKYGVSTDAIAGCWKFDYDGEYVNKCAERDAAAKTAWIGPLVISLGLAGFGIYVSRAGKKGSEPSNHA